MLRDSFLTLHVLAVIAWLGCGLYELFLSHEIRKARGTDLEIPLIQIYGRYAVVVPVATIVVAVMGVLMSIYSGWGFFQQLWLGTKQAIMLAIILDMHWMTPVFKRAYREINALSDNTGPELERYRATLVQIDRHVIPMRLGGLIAVVLAVWRPA